MIIFHSVSVRTVSVGPSFIVQDKSKSENKKKGQLNTAAAQAAHLNIMSSEI